MKELTTLGNQGRVIGYVQLRVGSRVYAVPVQAIKLDRDLPTAPPGGFFSDAAGQLGIIVDEDASPTDVQSQIASASVDAVKFISKSFLN